MCQNKAINTKTISYFFTIAIIASVVAANACQFLRLEIRGVLSVWVVSFIVLLAVAEQTRAWIKTRRQCRSHVKGGK